MDNNSSAQQESSRNMFGISVMWLIILLTVVGNLATLAIIITKKSLRNRPDARFLLSLSCADLAVGLFVMTPYVFKIMNGSWQSGLVTCKLWITADVTFCSASIYNLIGISLDRFQAVTNPLGYARTVADKDMRTTTVMIVSAWIMAFIISSPMHLDIPGFSTFPKMTEEASVDCMPPVDPDSLGFVLYSSTLAFFIPFLILGGLQSFIFYKRNTVQSKRVHVAREDARLQELRSQLTTQVTVEDVKFPDLSGSRSHPFTSTPTSTSIDCGESLNVQEIAELEGELGTMIRNRKKSKAWKKLEREKITTMMAVVVGGFTLCWFPFAIMFVLFPTNEAVSNYLGMENPALIDWITWIGYVNSSINPVIYVLMNPRIRETAASFLKLKN